MSRPKLKIAIPSLPVESRNLSAKDARRVLQVVDAGLIDGVGNPIPGQMCVEAAVCYALGYPHGDNPKCVGSMARTIKIDLNDADAWPSDKARAKGMRELSVAQLGSNQINQRKFVGAFLLGCLQRLLPVLLKHFKFQEWEKATKIRSVNCFAFLQKLESSIAEQIREKPEFEYKLSKAEEAIGYAQYAVEQFKAGRLERCLANCANLRNVILSGKGNTQYVLLVADICLQALKKCKSPGCKWLYLCRKS